jgi:subtilisin family serine protease
MRPMSHSMGNPCFTNQRSASLSSIEFLPITSAVLSTDTGSPVRFSVTNKSSSPLTIYWIDRSGNETAYGTIPTGQSYSQSTSTSHAWEVKSADGKVGFKFLPTVAGNITVDASYSNSFSDYSEKIMQTADGAWSTAQGYGLINVAKSLGIDDLSKLTLNGQNNNLALNTISAPAAWAAGYTGKGVKVAVIDIGIAYSSEVNSSIVGGYDFYDNDTTPQPDAGAYKDHALGVASIIAASHSAHVGQDTRGVAPDASLLNVRVGSNQTGSASPAIASGIRYAVDNGAKVICMPLQNSGSNYDQAVADAVHYAFQHNVVTVVIGGNYSNYGPTGPAMIAKQLKGEVIDVGNYNAMAGTAFESSNMPGTDPFPWVMASSSGYVPNSSSGYTYWADGGTSFAGPYVAGLAALLFQQSPDATASDIIKKILAGASLGTNEVLAGTSTKPAITQADVTAAVNKAIEATKAADAATAAAAKVAADAALAKAVQEALAGKGYSQADLTAAVNKAVEETKAADALAASAAAATAKVAADAALAKAVQDALAGADSKLPDVHVASSIGATFSNGSGADVFVGIGGVNTLQYAGVKTVYTVSQADGHFTVTDKAGSVVDSLYNVERLMFSDGAVALDINGKAGEVYRLYQAALNRAPDKGGLGYWIDAYDKGMPLATVAEGFVKSDEFQKLYGAQPSNEQLVNAMYQNVLHRAPDAAGLTYWLDGMSHGVTATSLLLAFSDSAENKAAALKIIGQGFDYTPYHAG